MLLLRLWNYIRGYVIILVEGYFLEKFVNICIRRQILLWDIKRQKNSMMALKVSIKGFKLLRPIARKTGCRVRIVRKRGLPFIINRYRGRKTFILGAAVFIVLFYFMTSFVWTIEVTGNEKVETDLILNELVSMGVKPGVLKYKIDPEDIANSIIIDIRELSWVNVMVKGTKVKVEVAEGVNRPPMVPKEVPCNIVAGKDGVIKSIVVKAGQEAVRVGDTVKKGQLLISGTVPIKNQDENPRKVHAMGVVKARTWYENKQPVNLKVVEKIRTGEKQDNISLVLPWNKVGLFHKKIMYGDFDRVEMKKTLSIGEDFVLPFGIVIERYYENSIVEALVSLEEAKKNAADVAYEEASSQVPENAKIVNTSLSFLEKDDGGLVSDVIIECIEDIAVTKEIGGK